MGQVNKPFSGTKNGIARIEKQKGRVTHKVSTNSKKDKNLNKMEMRHLKKKETQLQQKSISIMQKTNRGVPRIISLIPLNSNINCSRVWENIVEKSLLRQIICPIEKTQETDYSATMYISDSFKTTIHPIMPKNNESQIMLNNEDNSSKLKRSSIPMVEQSMFADFIIYITNESGPDDIGRGVIDSINKMKLKQKQFVIVLNTSNEENILLANAILSLNIVTNEFNSIQNQGNINFIQQPTQKVKKFSDKHLRYINSFFSTEATIYMPFDYIKTSPIFIRNLCQSSLLTSNLQQYITSINANDQILNAQTILRLAPWNMLRPVLSISGVSIDPRTHLINLYGFVRGALPLTAKQIMYIQGVGEMEIVEICGTKCDFSTIREPPSLPLPVISNRTMFSISSQHTMERRSDENFNQITNSNGENVNYKSPEEKGMCNVDGTPLFRNNNSMENNDQNECMNVNFEEEINNEETDDMVHNNRFTTYNNTYIENRDNDDDDDNDDNDETIDINTNLQKDIENKMSTRLSEQDLEDRFKFADEIDIHPNLPISEVLKGWRGVKSLRTSVWANPRLTEPDGYDKIFQPSQPMQISALCVRDLLMNNEFAAQPGTFISVQLKPNPQLVTKYYTGNTIIDPNQMVQGMYNLILSQLSNGYASAIGLFRHETKDGMLHTRLNLDLLSQREIIGQYTPIMFLVGFRRVYAQPIFSIPVSPDKSRIVRFAYGQTTYTVSFPAPLYINFDSLPPVLACVDENEIKTCKITEENSQFKLITQLNNINTPNGMPIVMRQIASGRSVLYDTNHILIQRIILCGDPYHISKRRTTIRCMFFSKEDVKYFSPIELTTKGGRTGSIISSIGTKGYFKAFFDSPINHSDVVTMKLYKRIYPTLNSVRIDSAESSGNLLSSVNLYKQKLAEFEVWHTAIADSPTIEDVKKYLGEKIGNINFSL